MVNSPGHTVPTSPLSLLPEDDHVWHGGAALLLALAQWASGDLEEAQRIHVQGVASLEHAGDITLAISAAFNGAELRKARCRLSEARRLYERSLQLGLDHNPMLPGVADLHWGSATSSASRTTLKPRRTIYDEARN